jgi:hypothetical protein
VIPLPAKPIQGIYPLPKIELIGTDTRRVAGRTARQETLLPGRDGFMGRDSDHILLRNQTGPMMSSPAVLHGFSGSGTHCERLIAKPGANLR